MDNKKITGECCGRPMQYSTEPKCNYNDCCMGEYCGCKLGRIKEMEPTCDSTAVIPSITVQSVDGITNLANCLVHVEDTNTTYYVDDKHRIMITWAGPVDIPGYDMDANPNKYKDQIVTDVEKGVAVIYDKHGNGYIFGITQENLQTAINNKLDEMAANGTLAQIVTAYISDKFIFGFDTVADMKASTDLVEGGYAETLGYYAKNDGGGSLYKIRLKTPEESTDSGGVIRLDNFSTTNLVAELIPGRQVTPNQFGAYGDGTHDDILACRACHNYARAKGIEMGGVRHSVYGVSESFRLLLNGYDFNNATFKALNAMREVILFHPYRSSSEKIPNEYLKNIIVDCDGKADYGIHQDQGGAITYVNNVNVINHREIGFYMSYGSVRLVGCKVEQRDLTRHSVGFQTDGWDSEFIYITTKNCSTGIKITSEGNTLTSCHPSMFEPTLIPGSRGFDLYAYTSLVNCVPDTYQYGIYINHAYGLTAVNCHCLIEPTFYNVDDVPGATPYFFYTANTSNAYNEGITITGCWLQHNIYDGDVIHFTNFPQWTGSSLRLNNPKLNDNLDYLKYVPSEIKQHRAHTDITSYLQTTGSVSTARIYTNGNMFSLRLLALELPATASGSELVLADNLPNYVLPSINLYRTVITRQNVICQLVFTPDGIIKITPYSGNIAASDYLYIDEIFLK